jgi:hypothetical protein
MEKRKTIEADKAKELALVTAIIINEDILGGTIFQTFDTAYHIAEKFVAKYGYDEYTYQIEWGVDAEFDETVIDFASNYRETWV